MSADTAIHDIELFRDKVVKVSPLLPKAWEAFALENAIPHQRWKVKALGGALGVSILSGALWWWQSTPPPPVPTTPETTPFEQYIASYSQQHSAYMALRQALSLYIETRDMPNGMMSTAMTWGDGKLTLPIDVTARDKVVRDYFKAHPALNREWDGASRELVRNTPSVSPWKEWHIKDYLVQMRDALELMDVSVTRVSTLPLAFIHVQTFELKATGHIGKLIAMTEALNAPFVSITRFHWTWQGENQHQLTLKIDVQGVTQ